LPLLLFLPAALSAQPPQATAARAAVGAYTSATVCASCHQDIYKLWSASMHSLTMGNPIFRAELRRAESLAGAESTGFCLTCHSPTSPAGADLWHVAGVGVEGVTCDFCHTAVAVDQSTHKPQIRTAPGPVKQGPWGDAVTSAHRSVRSTLLTRAEFCAGCHELRSPQGVPIIETYSEWKAGPWAAQGKQCQDCHMQRLAGKFNVDQNLRPSGRLAPDHSALGGSSLSRLEQAADIRLSLAVSRTAVNVSAEVTNTGAGHRLPTGLPLKRLRLRIAVTDASGVELASREFVYAKRVADAESREITSIAEAFLRTAKILQDNRLAPGETRKEQFRFRPPLRGDYLKARATLTYEFDTPVGNMRTVIAKADAFASLPTRWETLVIWVGALSLILLLALRRLSRKRRPAAAT